MITDADVMQLFRNIGGTPVGFTASEITGSSSQIERGMPAYLWKEAHPGGCVRHMMVFNKFGVIPKYCFDCYKVLITPRTIVELFKLLMIFEKIPLDNTRKCMVEIRPDCSGAYKGFIYCRSIEEGSEVRKIVRKVVSEDISPHVPVTLKRGCSEYERVHPKYARTKPGEVIMQYKKDWQIHEDLFDQNISFPPRTPDVDANHPTTFTPLEISYMRLWLSYAATIGDMSYLAIAGMTMPPIPNLKRPPFGIKTPLKKK